MTLRDDQILDVFRELPGHRGCSVANLDAAEEELNVQFPSRYRELMELDSQRLCGAGIMARLEQLPELRRDANDLLLHDGFQFRLKANDVVFVWDEIYAFYFFSAEGQNDPATMMFNYNDPPEDGKPVVVSDSLTGYVTNRLRRYLNLG